ncbi:glutamate-5-semialdehyde dehydrogenase [uncultured Apibacter sp.]|uniref:glutamate-5-semialdehyde dehydrogenase n=1 Tax=uncultured Apibacter sp. TaxID=1778616 RepID=UPI0025E19CE2|nr:glutamate-5-semialdehyde dehydrogenase [uncultured Apibacter sp.]
MSSIYQNIFSLSAKASKELQLIEEKKITQVLQALAKETENSVSYILSENKKDIERMPSSDPKFDRLLLTQERIFNIIKDIHNVSNLSSPIGKKMIEKNLPNGLNLSKISVPFGVIGIIYEARPNVSFDVFSLCLKSSNACILKGGSDAYFSNSAIVTIIKKVLQNENINPNICTFLPNDRSSTLALLHASNYVDLIIPRGSKGLINFVRENSKIPVIETGAGVCHTYFHKDGNLDIGKKIIFNAKTRKVSVCNSLDCLLIDSERINDLPDLCKKLEEKEVILYADECSYNELINFYPSKLLCKATQESFGTEFLDYKMAIKTVHSLEEAIDHITTYGSKHSEAIISENRDCINIFEKMVDAACVYANASTAFTDGAQFDMGAEIGISTQKMHARGPMGLEELCTHKWIVEGNGQIRS